MAGTLKHCPINTDDYSHKRRLVLCHKVIIKVRAKAPGEKIYMLYLYYHTEILYSQPHLKVCSVQRGLCCGKNWNK